MKKNDLLKKDVLFEKFNSLDFLIGQIVSVRKIKKKNLLSFKVDVKNDVLNIISREDYNATVKQKMEEMRDMYRGRGGRK